MFFANLSTLEVHISIYISMSLLSQNVPKLLLSDPRFFYLSGNYFDFDPIFTNHREKKVIKRGLTVPCKDHISSNLVQRCPSDACWRASSTGTYRNASAIQIQICIRSNIRKE